MKARITKPDGTVIDLEGSPDEVAKILDLAPTQAVPQFVPVPYAVPVAPAPVIEPYIPPWQSPFYVTCHSDVGSVPPLGSLRHQ